MRARMRFLREYARLALCSILIITVYLFIVYEYNYCGYEMSKGISNKAL